MKNDTDTDKISKREKLNNIYRNVRESSKEKYHDVGKYLNGVKEDISDGLSSGFRTAKDTTVEIYNKATKNDDGTYNGKKIGAIIIGAAVAEELGHLVYYKTPGPIVSAGGDIIGYIFGKGGEEHIVNANDTITTGNETIDNILGISGNVSDTGVGATELMKPENIEHVGYLAHAEDPSSGAEAFVKGINGMMRADVASANATANGTSSYAENVEFIPTGMEGKFSWGSQS